MAVEDVALDRLTEAGGAAGRVGFPSGIERERAAERKVRLLRHLLQGDDVFLLRCVLLGDVVDDAPGLLIDRFQ
jgi:hypothetical protein